MVSKSRHSFDEMLGPAAAAFFDGLEAAAWGAGAVGMLGTAGARAVSPINGS